MVFWLGLITYFFICIPHFHPTPPQKVPPCFQTTLQITDKIKDLRIWCNVREAVAQFWKQRVSSAAISDANYSVAVKAVAEKLDGAREKKDEAHGANVKPHLGTSAAKNKPRWTHWFDMFMGCGYLLNRPHLNNLRAGCAPLFSVRKLTSPSEQEPLRLPSSPSAAPPLFLSH